MKDFEQAGYRAQVLRLRSMATEVSKKFIGKNLGLSFINHGENATFKVVTGRKSYLLRLHRENYHHPNALESELKWLSFLESKGLDVQRPVRSKQGKLLELVKSPHAPERYCSLLEWKDGRERYKNLVPKNFYETGKLTALLHKYGQKKFSNKRKYWTAQGLLAINSTFGRFDELKTVAPKNYQKLNELRKQVYRKISAYEKKYPNKLSTIHADLHWGNLLWKKGKVFPIDFDDCGMGLHPYDLAVTLASSTTLFEKWGKKKAQECRDSLLEGYNSVGALTQADIDIIPTFQVARDIDLLLWILARKSNSQIYRHIGPHLKRVVKHSV